MTKHNSHADTMTAWCTPAGQLPLDVAARNALPAVGQHITEGMGRYRVLALLGGSLLEVESHVGTRLTIDWLNSGYRDPHNAWRVAR